jgi:hypothetical protein
MTDAQRLAFAARHFRDLQTIRFAPVPVAMMLAPALLLLPPYLSRGAAWALLMLFLSAIAGFYWWSTRAIRRRYGTIKEMKAEARRMYGHPVIILLNVALILILIAPHKPWPWADIYIVFMALINMLMTILDATNLASRRVAWAIGFVILFGAGPFLVGVDDGAVLSSLAGAVWLSLGTFDFLLLRRVMAVPPPQTSIRDAVMQHE